MRSSHRAKHLAAFLITLIVGCVLWSQAAWAALYKYQAKDGSVLITSDRRPDLKLLEVIDGGDDAGASAPRGASKKPKSKKAKRNMERAQLAKLKHVAKHGGKKFSVDDLNRSEREAAFDDIIREASEAYNIPFSFIKAVIKVESAFNPYAVSHAGAQGMMQLMPSVASNLNVKDPFNPRQNIFGGAKLLRALIDRYNGDINLILAAYNAGGVAVNRYKGIPYPQTRGYVASVYRWYKIYSAAQ